MASTQAGHASRHYALVPKRGGVRAGSKEDTVRLSVVVWAMTGIACWHFAVVVPDRFWGGIIGALLAAVLGALISGFLLPQPGIPAANPPGVGEALWAFPARS